MGNPTRMPNGVSTAVRNSALWSFPDHDPTKVHQYFNDFHTYTAADWTVTETGSGTRALLADEPFGALLVTNAAADNDRNEFQLTTATYTLGAGKKAWFKARFKVSDATQSDWTMGLIVLDTTQQGAISGAGVTDGIFFNKDDGDALIDIQCQKTATAGQTRAAGIATCDTSYHTYGWYYDGISEVKYFIDDVQLGTLTTTSAYLPDGTLSVSFALMNGEAVAKTMTVDYIFAAVER